MKMVDNEIHPGITIIDVNLITVINIIIDINRKNKKKVNNNSLTPAILENTDIALKP